MNKIYFSIIYFQLKPSPQNPSVIHPWRERDTKVRDQSQWTMSIPNVSFKSLLERSAPTFEVFSLLLFYQSINFLHIHPFIFQISNCANTSKTEGLLILKLWKTTNFFFFPPVCYFSKEPLKTSFPTICPPASFSKSNHDTSGFQC